MLRYFPPFPSPNPATNHSPLENAPIVPSPPSSDASSLISSASSPTSTPSPIASPISPTNMDAASSTGSSGSNNRSRSRSSARRCAPPGTRIMQRKGSNSNAPPNGAPASPPITPPLDQQQTKFGGDNTKPSIQEEEESNTEGVARKKSVRKHHYEDAVRIACAAWCETSGHSQPNGKKKSVRWEEGQKASG